MTQVGIFFLLFISTYAALNLYACAGLSRALASPRGRLILWALWTTGALSFVISRRFPPEDARLLYLLLLLGGLHTSLLFHSALVLAVFHGLRLLGMSKGNPRREAALALAAFGLASTLGGINAFVPSSREIEVEVGKPTRGEIRVLFMSDLHLDLTTPVWWLKRVVEMANGASPDLIALGGDVAERDLDRFGRGEIFDLLGELKAPLGVVAIPGNHDYYGGFEGIRRALERRGIVLLTDEALELGDMVIVGRNDRHALYFGEGRLPLEELLREGLPRDRVWVLLDHRPVERELASRLGFDLMLSGHTHNGQMFPLNLVVAALFPNPFGLERVGSMWQYTSCGVGLWGPPLRTTSRPELVLLRIRGRGADPR